MDYFTNLFNERGILIIIAASLFGLLVEIRAFRKQMSSQHFEILKNLSYIGDRSAEISLSNRTESKNS